MVARFPLALLFLTSPLGAQGFLAPRLAVNIGPHDIRSIAKVGALTTVSSNGMSLFGGMGVGLGLGHGVALDADYRRAFNGEWSFTAKSIGVVVQSNTRRGYYGRFAVIRLAGTQPDDPGCGDETEDPCPGPNGEGQTGIEASVGINFSLGPHLALGPRLSWARSTTGKPSYRLIGLRMNVVLFGGRSR